MALTQDNQLIRYFDFFNIHHILLMLSIKMIKHLLDIHVLYIDSDSHTKEYLFAVNKLS